MAVLWTLVIVVQYETYCTVRPQAPVTGTYLRLRGGLGSRNGRGARDHGSGTVCISLMTRE